jgi:translation initiation factor 2D
VKDEMLPLSSSILWAQHMQPWRPAQSTLDLKKSRHKKMGALLKARIALLSLTLCLSLLKTLS